VIAAPSLSQFDADTAVWPEATNGDGPGGRWDAVLSDRWSVAGRPNGGYLLATAVRAMVAQSGRAHPMSVTAHYLQPSAPGLAVVDVEVIKQGRTQSTVTASLYQEANERLRVIGAFANLDGLVGPSRESPPGPDLPPLADCPDLATLGVPEGMNAQPEILHRFDLRIDPRVGWPRGRRAGTDTIGAWIRFLDGRPPDVASLPLFADALPPPVFDLLPTGWVPTISLTVMVRAVPVPGWLRAVFRTRTIEGGTVEEDGEVWDDAGRLVCLSRQLAVVLPPAPPG
jgi:acyl-CoA thioesterase